MPIDGHFGIDWGSVDWGKSSKEIAIELGTSFTTVSNKRKELFGGRKVKMVDWRVDWGMNNVQLASQLGVSVSSVVYHRKLAGIKSPKMGRPGKYNWNKVDWSMKNREISEYLGIPAEIVAAKRSKLKNGDKNVGEEGQVGTFQSRIPE